MNPMKDKRLIPSSPVSGGEKKVISDPRLIPAEPSEASYSDKALGWAKAVVEKGGGSPRAIEEIAAENEGLTDTVLDTGFGAAQGLTYSFVDEGIGAAKALLEKGGGSQREMGDLYAEGRDGVRSAWKEARERTPFGTSVGEVAGSMVSPANMVLSAGKGLRGILRGAAEGGAMSYGATEKQDGLDQGVETLLGAGIGAGTGALNNFVSQRFNKSPDAIRAEVLGVKSKDYIVEGPGDRAKVIKRVKETNLFKNRKMEYNAETMKFEPVGKSKFKIDELEANTEERLKERAQDAVNKLQDRKDRLFGQKLNNTYIPSSELDRAVGEIVDEYITHGLMKGPFAREAAVKNIRDNMYDHVVVMGGNTSSFSLSEIDMLKHMAQEDVRNFSKGLGELGDNDELMRITARKLKELLEKGVNDPLFKQINSAQHDFLSVRSDLNNKLRGLDLATPSHQHLEKTNMIEGALKDASGGSQGRLDAAQWKELYQKYIPEPVRAVIPYAAQELPGTLYRQNIQGQEMQGNWRKPNSVQNIPEELIRTPLPRSTEGLMKNKNFVLAKVAQQAPEMFEAVKDVFENSPEGLGELAQVLSMKMPHFFEKDKYNRFDGRILSEKDKNMAVKDTLSNDQMSSIEKAKIITKLNKEGLYDH